MGIPRFIGQWLIKQGFPGTILQAFPGGISSLSIDLNALIHSEAQRVYAYGEFHNEAKMLEIAKLDPLTLEHDLFVAVTTRIMKLIGQVTFFPASNRAIERTPAGQITSLMTLVLAVDGVAPQAKINQQRSRRFQSAQERNPNLKFDSNCITPGTEFMFRFNDYMIKWLNENRNALPTKIIYSSHMVPGEGEHKIMDFIRQGELELGGGFHVIHGMDADFVMLTLVAPINNIILWREDIRQKIHIDNLRTALVARMKNIRLTDVKSEESRLLVNSTMRDFILIMFLLGNDFLPHQPSLNDFGVVINALLDIYRELSSQPTPFYMSESKVGGSEGDEGGEDKETNERDDVNWPNYIIFLGKVAEIEPRLLKHEAGRSVLPSRAMKFATQVTTTSIGNEKETIAVENISLFSYENFRTYWYHQELTPRLTTNNAVLIETIQQLGIPLPEVTIERVVKLVQDYLTTIGWAFKYYIKGISAINVSWAYEHYATPLFSDISAAEINFESLPYINLGQSVLNPVHQLLSVLPASSRNLVPYEVRHLMNYDSPITYYYPSSFLRETDGKDAAWQGVSILPFVDPIVIINTVSQYGQKFSRDRLEQFSPSGNIIIVRNDVAKEALESKRLYEERVRLFQERAREARGTEATRGTRGRGSMGPRGRGIPMRGGLVSRGGYVPSSIPEGLPIPTSVSTPGSRPVTTFVGRGGGRGRGGIVSRQFVPQSTQQTTQQIPVTSSITTISDDQGVVVSRTVAPIVEGKAVWVAKAKVDGASQINEPPRPDILSQPISKPLLPLPDSRAYPQEQIEPSNLVVTTKRITDKPLTASSQVFVPRTVVPLAIEPETSTTSLPIISSIQPPPPIKYAPVPQTVTVTASRPRFYQPEANDRELEEIVLPKLSGIEL